MKALTLCVLLTSQICLAQTDQPLIVKNKQILPYAVQMQITPKGAKLFQDHFQDILFSMGQELDNGHYDAQEFISEQPIDLDELEKSNPTEIKLVKKIRELMSQWFVGLKFNPHRPALRLGDTDYVAKINRLALYTEPELMKQLKKENGAVLSIEVEVEKIIATTDSIQLQDQNNPFLGKFGFEKVGITIGNKTHPLKIKLPFYAYLDKYQQLKFEALKIEQNVEKIPITFKFKNIIVPTIAVEINGNRYPLNTKELEKYIDESSESIFSTIRSKINEFSKKDLPQLLNQQAENIKRPIEQIQDFPVAGKPENDIRPDFKFGLVLSAIDLDRTLNFAFHTYIEDPLRTKITPYPKNILSRGAPDFSKFPLEQYDLALSLDRSIMNRLMQLSFLRGNFKTIPQKDGGSISITAAPVVDYLAKQPRVKLDPREGFIKLNLQIETDPGKKYRLILDKKIQLSFDVIVKLQRGQDDKGLDLVLYDIDLNSFKFDDSRIRFIGQFFKNKIYEGVKERLKETATEWKKTEEKLTESPISLPPIIGLNLKLLKLDITSKGHIVLYTNYSLGDHHD